MVVRKADSQRMQAVIERPRSTNVIKIRNFRKFNWLLLKVYEEFSKIASSFINMLKNIHEFQCAEKYARVFQEFKQQVLVTRSLAVTVGSKDYTIMTNASKDRTGCVLLQEYHGVAYILSQFRFAVDISQPMIQIQQYQSLQ